MRLHRVVILSFAIFSGCAHLDGPQVSHSKSSNTNSNTNYVYGLDAADRAPAAMCPTEDPVSGGQIDPVHMRSEADYHFAAAEALSLEGAHKKAIEKFKLALVYDPDSVAISMRLATEYLRAGLVTDAVQTAEAVVGKNPKNTDARILLGGLYSSLRLFPKAVEQYSKVMELDKKNTDAPLYLGAVYSEMKQPQKAIKLFEALLKNPELDNPEQIHYYIGRVYSEIPGQANKLKAETEFKKALSLKPNYTDAVLAWAALKTSEHTSKEVIDMLESFQKKNGPNMKVAEILAQYYIQKEMFDEAYEQYENIESLSPENLDAKMRMALILIEKHMYDPAIAKLNEILEIAPDSDRVRFYLGAIHEERKDAKSAIESYKLVPTFSQYYPEAVLHAGFLMHEIGDVPNALTYLDKVLSDGKLESPQVIALYASILDETGDSPKALDLLKKSVEKYPESYQIRFYLGALYDKAGDKEKTLQEMAKVLELDPNHAQALNYMAFTLIETSQKYDEAEKYAQKAVQLEPKDGYILDTMGWVLFKKGKKNEAIRYLETAYRYQPDVSIIAEHLGDVYVALALVDKATDMYQKAIELEKDQSKVSAIRTKLGQITHQQMEDRKPASKNP